MATVEFANAKAKAEQYARLMGVKIGQPTYVVEGAQQSNTNIYGNYYSGNLPVHRLHLGMLRALQSAPAKTK